MDIEFHYHINYLIALKSGFDHDDSYKIAYSAQYTDDNIYARSIKNWQNQPIYAGIKTQSYQILSAPEEMQDIHLCFHFQPGDAFEGSKSNCIKDLKVTPNSKISSKALDASLKGKNPYLIGIASHVYADTFAHQNFIGIRHDYNAIDKFPQNIIPNYGHADFGHAPDIVNLIWKDHRMKKVISNKQRFLEAATMMYQKYINYTEGIYDDNFIAQIDEAIGEETHCEIDSRRRLSNRIANYNSLAKEIYLSSPSHLGQMTIPNYNKYLWYEKAKLRADKLKSTHWFGFQEAAKEYRRNMQPIITWRSAIENHNCH